MAATNGCMAARGVGVQLLEPRLEQLVVVELVRRLTAERGLVGQRRRQLGVRGQPAEGRELAVRHRAEQVDDGLAVVGIGERVRLVAVCRDAHGNGA